MWIMRKYINVLECKKIFTSLALALAFEDCLLLMPYRLHHQRCNDYLCSRCSEGSVVVSTSACHAAGRGSLPGPGACKTWLCTLEIVYLCLLDETLKRRWSLLSGVYARGSKEHTSLHWKCVTCRGLHILA